MKEEQVLNVDGNLSRETTLTAWLHSQATQPKGSQVLHAILQVLAVESVVSILKPQHRRLRLQPHTYHETTTITTFTQLLCANCQSLGRFSD
jgi:hypothetical protein